MSTFHIAVLPGDGIGPEIMAEAVKVLRAAVPDFSETFQLEYSLVGGAAYEEFGVHCPDSTIELCRRSDAILFGAVGGPADQASLPKWKGCETNSILKIRKELDLYANIRPVQVYPELASASPLKEEIIAKGIDLVIVRELKGDIYFGEHSRRTEAGKIIAKDVAEYHEDQIRRIAKTAFALAAQRSKRVTSVDKANVLETSRLWREIVADEHRNHPEISLEHMLVDNCAMQLIRAPDQFDVIVTANLFGDILSDAAASLPGSLGLLGSASYSGADSRVRALYEPPSGSAPDIAGKGIANPIGQILCAAMMLRDIGQPDIAFRIEEAVKEALRKGWRTRDISRSTHCASTSEMGDAIKDYI